MVRIAKVRLSYIVIYASGGIWAEAWRKPACNHTKLKRSKVRLLRYICLWGAFERKLEQWTKFSASTSNIDSTIEAHTPLTQILDIIALNLQIVIQPTEQLTVSQTNAPHARKSLATTTMQHKHSHRLSLLPPSKSIHQPNNLPGTQQPNLWDCRPPKGVTRMAYSPRLWLMAIGWWNKINQCQKLKLNLTQTWGVCMSLDSGMHWSQNQLYCDDSQERNKFRARRSKRTQSLKHFFKKVSVSHAQFAHFSTLAKEKHMAASHLELLHTHIYHKC